MVFKDYLKKAKDLARDRWDKDVQKGVFAKSDHSYIKSVESVETAETRKLLTKYRVFRVKVFNPVSRIAGRPFYHYSLIISKEDYSVYYLENDEHVAEFLSGLSIKAKNEKAVKDVLGVFASLRDYELREEPDGELRFFHGCSKFGEKDWKPVIKKIKDGWDILVTYLVDSYINSYGRYEIRMSFDGVIEAKFMKSASQNVYI